jgi:hypothetical protein
VAEDAVQTLVELVHPDHVKDVGALVQLAVSVMLVPTVGVWLLADSEHWTFGPGAAACCQTSETTTGPLVLDALLAVRTYDLPPALLEVAWQVVD